MTWDADDSAHFRRVPSPNDLRSHLILMTWDADDSAHFRRVPSPNDLRSHLILMTWDAYDSAHFRRVPSPNDLRSHLILDPGIEVIWFPWFYSTQMSSWHLHNSFMTWLTRLRWVRDIYITRDSKSLSRESKKSFDSRLRNRESRIWNHRSLLQKSPIKETVFSVWRSRLERSHLILDPGIESQESVSRLSSLDRQTENIVSFIGLFCKRDLWFYRSY